jgi:hypothetical protein
MIRAHMPPRCGWEIFCYAGSMNMSRLRRFAHCDVCRFSAVRCDMADASETRSANFGR